MIALYSVPDFVWILKYWSVSGLKTSNTSLFRIMIGNKWFLLAYGRRNYHDISLFHISHVLTTNTPLIKHKTTIYVLSIDQLYSTYVYMVSRTWHRLQAKIVSLLQKFLFGTDSDDRSKTVLYELYPHARVSKMVFVKHSLRMFLKATITGQFLFSILLKHLQHKSVLEFTSRISISRKTLTSHCFIALISATVCEIQRTRNVEARWCGFYFKYPHCILNWKCATDRRQIFQVIMK